MRSVDEKRSGNDWDDGMTCVKKKGRFPRIGHVDGEMFTFPQHPQQLIEDLRGYPMDLLTFFQHPSLKGVRYDYWMEMDNMAVLSITTFQHWYEKQVGNKLRKWLKTGQQAGVVVEEIEFCDELLRAICTIYNETPVRQGAPFEHYGMTMERVRAYAGTFEERSIFLAAKWQGEIIGFAKICTTEDQDFAAFLHILSMVKHRDKGPTNALVGGAVKACETRGIRQLSYGQFSYGDKTGDGLQEFEQRNGFERLDVPRYWFR